jgi:hypothetical protein
MTGLTITSISANERKAIAETGTALYVSPKSYDRCPHTFAALHQHLVSSLLAYEATKLVQSGYSYYAVIFDSKVDRDSGARTLKEKPFLFEGEDIALTVENFVNSCFNCITILRFPASISDTPEAVMEAFKTLFKSADQKCPVLNIMKRAAPFDMWTVIFVSTVTWLPKQLLIGTTSRVVRKEESLCAVCFENSQSPWSCPPKEEGMQLYPGLSSQTGDGEAPCHNHAQI